MHELINKYKKGDNKSLESIVDEFIPFILKEASRYKIKCYSYEDLL